MSHQPFLKWKKIFGSILLGLALLVGTVAHRLVREGKQRVEEARGLLDRGDHFSAVAAFEDAAKAYVPFSSYHQRALRELELMAKGAVMRGDTEAAVAIWRVVRRSVLATRHFWQPGEDVLVRAEQAIARLRIRASPEKPSVPGPPMRPEDPNPIFAMMLFLGFLLWIGGATVLCVASGRGVWKYRKLTWAAAVVGLVTWLFMAWLAP